MRVVKKTQDSSADFSANYTGGVIYAGRMGFGSVQVEWDIQEQSSDERAKRSDGSHVNPSFRGSDHSKGKGPGGSG